MHLFITRIKYSYIYNVIRLRSKTPQQLSISMSVLVSQIKLFYSPVLTFQCHHNKFTSVVSVSAVGSI